jgi:non-canonical (house-cleaning) NTP pyrophosphatase
VLVLVGSTRPAKIEGAREALDAIARIDPRFASFSLEAHDLTHIAPRMPMSLAEILEGARRRASAVMDLQRPTTRGTPEPRNPGTSEPQNPSVIV